MKYTEFEAKVKEVNASLTVVRAGRLLYVRSEVEGTLLNVKKREAYCVDFAYIAWRRASDTLKGMLYGLAVELAATPLEEREEPKKYYYRIPYVAFSDGYLNYDSDDHIVFYHDKTPSQTYQTRFTRKEYEEIAKKHDIPANLHIEEEVK